MKVAFLILAHQDPKQFERLIKALYSNEVSFFVHVDKKTAIEPFYLSCKNLKNVHFIDENERIKIYWGGFNMVKATILLMQKAYDSSENYKYFVTLSGVDYPIKSNKFILGFLEKTNLEYVRYYKIPNHEELEYDNGGLDRIEKFYFQDCYFTNTQKDKTKIVSLISRSFNLLFRNFPIKRSYPSGFIPYGGWQHMVLTYSCVEYILDFLQAHTNFKNYHKYTHVPDEIMFQTIIMNSPFKERVVNDNLKYIDYGVVDDNYILTTRHFNALKQSNALFARKFMSDYSERLLELIDNHLRNSN